MGRVKTTQIKRITKKLVAENRSKFKKDFESNKKVVDSLAEIQGKKLRNVIAGYATRLMSEKKE